MLPDDFPGQGTNKITFDPVLSSDVGEYTVTVSGPGCLPDITTATATLTISPFPEVECPDTVSVDCNENIAMAFSTWLSGFMSDEGDGTVESYDVTVDGNPVAIEDLVAPTDTCNGSVINITFKATNACGEVDCSSSFTLNASTEDPTFDSQPGDIADINCDDALPTQETLTASDDCSSVQVVASVDPYERDICGGNTVTYRWVATDACGNSTTVTRTFDILPDTEDPYFTSLPEVDTICNDGFPAELSATWADACSGGDTITVGPTNIRYREDMCAEYADYVFTAIDNCGNSKTETVTVEREFDKIDNCETVFGYRQESDCFLDYGFRRWGWTTKVTEPTDEFGIVFNLYAGNGNDCDPTDGPGTLAGTATLYYDGSYATVVYDMNNGYVLSEAHVYIGCTMFPQGKKGNTVAPGQYNFNPSLGGTVDGYTVGPIDVTDDFYIIIHGVSCEIACECSGGYTYTGDNGGGAFNGGSVDCEEAPSVASKSVDFKAYPVPFDQEVNIKY